MIRKEINEIKSLYTLENCGIHKLCGCFVDSEKNKVTKIDELFQGLPEEEKHKYFEIFKKTLSGTQGKNIFDMKFKDDAYLDEGAYSFLCKLKDSELKDETLLEKFYDMVIKSYNYDGKYLILLIDQAYDVPGKTNDNIALEDASEEVFRYILCSICPVVLSKSGLGYIEEENAFHNQIQLSMVDLPDVGFLFPEFNERSSDMDYLLYYSKNAKEFQQGILSDVLNCDVPLPANMQKETFQTLVTEALGEECDYQTIKNIHDNLNEMIDEKKGSAEPLLLDKTEVKELLERSGVKEERLEDFESHFENEAGTDAKLMASNIAETRKFEVKTPDVVIKVNPDRTDLIETMEIEGKQYLVIQIDEHLEVNGIVVNPSTGETYDKA